MSQFKLVDHKNDNAKSFDSRSEAQTQKADLENSSLGYESGDLEVMQVGSDDGQTEVVEPDTVEAEPVDDTPEPVDKLPDEKPAIDEDPVDWLPGHFVDEIQGVPTVNRKGYAVIASKYGIEVTSEPITLPSESEFEYAEFRAVAKTPDGEEYTGYGSAHIERQDGDDPYLLGELAETRAMKRSVAWASGIGLTAISELKGEL